jgi:nucleoside-diphosphate-sugar epimerase
MQFVHEDDLINIMGKVITKRKGGIFNVAADGTLKYSKVARMLNKKLIKLPYNLMEMMISFSWAVHLQNAAPAGCLKFIQYPPVISTAKLKKELGYQFKYSSQEALSCLAACLIKKK